jgi:hypothetical protein
MAISALDSRADTDAPGAPRPAVLWAIALAGVLAAAGAVALALTSDDPGQEPGLHALLLDWAALPYVLAGLIAWWRRPDSRLGPLMIAVGFLSFVPTLAWANAAVPITIGEAFDGLPPVLFLHVFLAFPSGRLERRLERAVVAAGYVAALGLQLVGMGLGGSGPDNLLAVVGEPGAAETLQRVQSVAIGALALAGIGVLAARRRRAGRPLRRSVPLRVIAGDRRFSARVDEGALAALVYAGGEPSHYGRLPAAVASALAGDPAPLRRLAEQYALRSAAAIVDPSLTNFTQNLATACHDYPRAFSYADPPAARRAAYERALAAIDPSEFLPFSPNGWTDAGFDAVDNCIEWPGDPAAGPPLAPGTVFPDVPVLVLSGDLDANTPSFAGRQAAAQFRRATFVEIPNQGHTPTGNPCATAVAARFIATLEANPRACAGTGTPPPVSGRHPRRAAELPLVGRAGTRAQRRALGLVVATVGDLQEQAATVGGWGAAGGLRGGRYVAGAHNTIRLLGVRVVFGARVSGALTLLPGDRLKGTLRLAGPAVEDGRLQVRLAPDGHGRATGLLGGRRVDLAFR